MKKAIALILLLAFAAFSYSCKGLIKNRQTTLVTVTIESGGKVALDVRPATLPVLAKRYLRRIISFQTAVAAVPANVQNLRLTVSATDMASIVQTVTVAGLDTVDLLVDVPNGLQRNFLVEGLDSGGIVTYNGSAITDLNGSPVLLTVTMTATGVFVSPLGTNTPPCSEAAPCLTIPYALTQTTSTIPTVFVSAGTYSFGGGFTVPANRSIICQGANHSSILSSLLTGGALITGNAGVTISGCAIVLGSSGATPIITDNNANILVNNCVVKGSGFAMPTVGIALSGNSTVQNSTIAGFSYISNSGISITGGSSLISSNTFTGNEQGISISGGTPLVELNTLTNNVSYSVNITGGNATIRNNQISASNNGISITAASATITGNTINNNIVYGIIV
ncbi:MAG TPA: right-handed parallel beta-helix repeat-containing protein, partial [Nitrospirota bacterium]|nr:right-handed parallel beta-helix repeat-containing protein [Nitrospirota bacterium]